MSGISVDVADHVARVTIDRPQVLNAIDPAAEQALQAAWERIEADPEIRAVVLTGAGEKAFSVGADMSGGDGPSGLEYWATPRPGGFGGIALRTSLDVPVIARVNGYALGGGLEMVLGCDLIVAAEQAQFGLPEARVGRLPLDGGLVELPRRLPRAFAMELLLTGKRINAAEAYRMGLINRVVPAASLDDAVDELLADILACAPLSLRATKQVVQRTGHLTAQEAQAVRLPALVQALGSKDAEEGVRAFQEKRAPVWSGQ
jgi:crotonobetainyl-CoA hydratase